MKNNILAMAAMALAVMAHGAMAAEEDVANTDPGRWFKAEDSPQGRYGNMLTEARAAHAQAVQECKALPRAEVRKCRNDADQAARDDRARAKRILNQAGGSDS